MRLPPRLVPLLEDGVIERVVRPLLSGKEAQVYLVEAGGELRVAKVYKGATERSFKNRADYTEGRAVRNSRDQRALGKGSRHSKERDEETWMAAEAEMIYKLAYAGVRVPKPYAFVEGVLIMECVEGPDGGPAPRLAECSLEPAYAQQVFERLIQEVVKMLCVDVVHGDLSPFNVLIDAQGPVIIDFPQSINAAKNRNAKEILLRDVANLTTHFKRGRPAHELRYAHEMWAFYERGELHPETRLTGRFDLPRHEVDAEKLLQQMMEVEEDEVLDIDEYGRVKR
jgi:RIO kinase 1